MPKRGSEASRPLSLRAERRRRTAEARRAKTRRVLTDLQQQLPAQLSAHLDEILVHPDVPQEAKDRARFLVKGVRAKLQELIDRQKDT